MAETSAEYAGLGYELVEISAVDLDQALLAYKIDIGFNRDSPQNEQLSFKLVSQDNFGLFLPETHWLQNDNFTSLDDVREEKFILPSLNNGSQYAEDLKEIFKANNFTPITFIESDFGATILSLIARGLGISVMPASYALQLPAKVRFIDLPYQTNLYAVWRKDADNAVLRNILTLLKICD